MSGENGANFALLLKLQHQQMQQQAEAHAEVVAVGVKVDGLGRLVSEVRAEQDGIRSQLVEHGKSLGQLEGRMDELGQRCLERGAACSARFARGERRAAKQSEETGRWAIAEAERRGRTQALMGAGRWVWATVKRWGPAVVVTGGIGTAIWAALQHVACNGG